MPFQFKEVMRSRIIRVGENGWSGREGKSLLTDLKYKWRRSTTLALELLERKSKRRMDTERGKFGNQCFLPESIKDLQYLESQQQKLHWNAKEQRTKNTLNYWCTIFLFSRLLVMQVADAIQDAQVGSLHNKTPKSRRKRKTMLKTSP